MKRRDLLKGLAIAAPAAAVLGVVTRADNVKPFRDFDVEEALDAAKVSEDMEPLEIHFTDTSSPADIFSRGADGFYKVRPERR